MNKHFEEAAENVLSCEKPGINFTLIVKQKILYTDFKTMKLEKKSITINYCPF